MNRQKLYTCTGGGGGGCLFCSGIVYKDNRVFQRSTGKHQVRDWREVEQRSIVDYPKGAKLKRFSYLINVNGPRRVSRTETSSKYNGVNSFQVEKNND